MNDLRDRLPPPESYYEARGILVGRGRGEWRTARCEKHGGSDSMRVNVVTGAYSCMARCGMSGGDVVAYQMQLFGQSFAQALQALGVRAEFKSTRGGARAKPRLPARGALEILVEDSNFVAISAASMAQGVQLSDEERGLLLLAANRIQVIAEDSQ